MKKRKRNNRRKNVSLEWETMQKVILSIILVCVVFIFVILVLSDSSQPTVQEPTAQQPGQTATVELKQHYAFIDHLAPIARENRKTYGVLPSISIAQAILESDWGKSELSAKYYNLFGVKGEENSADSVLLQTKEFINGQEHTVDDWFRIYRNWDESMVEHAKLLSGGVSWQPDRYNEVIQAANYVEAAYALERAGYATDPEYAEKLIGVIESNRLYLYDEE